MQFFYDCQAFFEIFRDIRGAKMPKRRKEFEKLIKDKGIKPTELAETLGYRSKFTVYKWIYGVAEPNAATMLRLI